MRLSTGTVVMVNGLCSRSMGCNGLTRRLRWSTSATTRPMRTRVGQAIDCPVSRNGSPSRRLTPSKQPSHCNRVRQLGLE